MPCCCFYTLLNIARGIKRVERSIFTIQDASRIALELYGLHISARPLPGECDYNFHLTTEAGSEFVLKIAPATAQRDVLDLQNRALEHIAARDSSLLVQQVCATSRGETIVTITTDANTEHFVRLLTYLPGCPLAKVKPHTSELLHNLGSLMGRVDRALQDFEHPAAHRNLKWNLPGGLWIRDYLPYIERPERRALIKRFLTHFEKQVLPVLSTLRTGIIHGDANDYNVLIGDFNTGTREVASVIDYGDMVHTQTVCEPAIAANHGPRGRTRFTCRKQSHLRFKHWQPRTGHPGRGS